MSTTVKPYSAQGSKKQQVATMFDNIAHSYDTLNHAFSLGIDILWRRKAVRSLRELKPQVIVDLATGTGDFAVEAAKLKPRKIIGLDISEGMLAIGRTKMQRKALSELIEMRQGDAENLPLETNSVDAITVGFGVRNFEHLEQGLAEMLRVLRPGGRAVILEPAVPQAFPMKQLFQLYFLRILPFFGRLISKDHAAYTYLPQSVRAFPTGKSFLDICSRVGYVNLRYQALTLGICAMYSIEKPASS